MLTGPASFLWLWVLPLAVLLALNVLGYLLVSGNLSDEQQRDAWLLGGALLLDLCLGVAAWAVTYRSMRAGREAAARHAAWGVPLILANVAYLWLATALGDDLLPRSVTAWIYPGERYLFNQYAFGMAPLFLGMLRLACAGNARIGGRVIAWHVSAAVLVPIGLYVLGVLARGADLPFWRIPETIMAVAMVGFGLLLFVCVIRVLVLTLRSRALSGPTGQRVGIFVFAFLLPVAGLALNESIPFPMSFQAPEVYVLTCVNAALLFASTFLTWARPRLTLFFLGATLPFTLYFFVVFLPYTPLAVLAILALGAGFLILAPTLLFTLHLHLAWQAAREATLAAPQQGLRLAAIGLAGCAVLPGWFTMRALSDRAALNTALDHAFTPAVSATQAAAYPGNLTYLRRAVSSHRAYKDGLYYPLLSDYYAWLAFDGLVLPDDKLDRIESLFFGTVTPSNPSRGDGFGFGGGNVRERHRMPRATPPPRTVEVREIRATTRPAGEGATTVTLALTLANTGAWEQAEYIRTLPLAPGVVVNGFRLHVNGEAVPGRLVEKKTALWVYTMIRDIERRDPGLLFYNAPDELELRVYPVIVGTPSIVELDFLVPATFDVDALPVESRDPAACVAALRGELAPVWARPSADAVVLAGLDRADLPVAVRPAYVHFLVDRSVANAFTGDVAAARTMLASHLKVAGPGRVTLVNHDVVPVEPREGVAFPPDAKEIARALPARGGMHLDLALAQALRRHRDEDLDRLAPDAPPPARPVFVILNHRLGTGIGELSLTKEWADLVSDIEIYELDETGAFRSCFGEPPPETPMLRLGGVARPWRADRLTRFDGAAQGGAEPAFWDDAMGSWRALDAVEVQAGRGGEGEASWPEAMALHLRHQDEVRDPGAGDSVAGLRGLVADSRRLGVLTPATSFIVVENAAQWRAMDEAERKKLGEHQALDHLETPAPSALVLLLALGGWAGARRVWTVRSRRRVTRISGC
ncbi:MAG: MSEP-CTERM sorting domain-containing protein [Burkholderiales bacterium]|nr:MSEP-CTERM sorting domain-containing protein [Opitutaceae bacterium]